MDTTFLNGLQGSRILLFEAGVATACLVSAFCLATASNFFGRKEQMVWSKVGLPLLAGTAVAVVLTVNHTEMPGWLFFVNLFFGLAIGYAAYLAAPSKSLMRRVMRKRPVKPAPGTEAGPSVLAAKLPEKARPSPGRKRREADRLPKPPEPPTAVDYARRMKAPR